MPKRRAFSLVELLVVIGIIALLIGILLPTLSRARQAAKRAKCAANLRTLGTVLEMYTIQTQYYPAAHGQAAGGIFNIWAPRLRNMVGKGSQPAFRCPSTDETAEWKLSMPNMPVATSAHTGFGYTVGEPVLDEFTFRGSYGYNDWGTDGYAVHNPPLGLGGDTWYPEPGSEVPIYYVRVASECIAITDAAEKQPGDWLANVDPTNPNESPSNRHMGGSNVLWADGHVEWRILRDIVLFDDSDPKHPHTATELSFIRMQWNNDHDAH